MTNPTKEGDRMRRVLIALIAVAALLGVACSAQAAVGDYEKIFVEAGKKNSINPNLLKAIAYRESGIHNAPCNGAGGGLGYCGVMQISGNKFGDKTRDPEFNINEGSAHFARCLRITDGNIIEALVCYNAGEGRVYDIHNGRLAYHVVKLDFPTYGKQTGRTPAWTSCKAGGYNDVCGYVHYVYDHFVEYQNATPYGRSGEQQNSVAPLRFAVSLRAKSTPVGNKIPESGKSGGMPLWPFILGGLIIVALIVVLKKPRDHAYDNEPYEEEWHEVDDGDPPDDGYVPLWPPPPLSQFRPRWDEE